MTFTFCLLWYPCLGLAGLGLGTPLPSLGPVPVPGERVSFPVAEEKRHVSIHFATGGIACGGRSRMLVLVLVST